MLYDKYTNVPKDIDAITDYDYAEYLDTLDGYTKQLNILRKSSIRMLDAIATSAPRRIALIVDAASVQVELGSITNAATILVQSKIRKLVELANQIIERAESLYEEVKQYEH